MGDLRQGFVELLEPHRGQFDAGEGGREIPTADHCEVDVGAEDGSSECAGVGEAADRA